MDKFKQAMTDPDGVYDKPNDVVLDNDLTTEQKISILKTWEYDAQELEAAAGENMDSPEGVSMLSRIHQALTKVSE